MAARGIGVEVQGQVPGSGRLRPIVIQRVPMLNVPMKHGRGSRSVIKVRTGPGIPAIWGAISHSPDRLCTVTVGAIDADGADGASIPTVSGLEIRAARRDTTR